MLFRKILTAEDNVRTKIWQPSCWRKSIPSQYALKLSKESEGKKQNISDTDLIYFLSCSSGGFFFNFLFWNYKNCTEFFEPSPHLFPMVTSYVLVVQYQKQGLDIGTELLSRVYTLFSFYQFIYAFICVYVYIVLCSLIQHVDLWWWVWNCSRPNSHLQPCTECCFCILIISRILYKWTETVCHLVGMAFFH